MYLYLIQQINELQLTVIIVKAFKQTINRHNSNYVIDNWSQSNKEIYNDKENWNRIDSFMAMLTHCDTLNNVTAIRIAVSQE